MELYTSLTQLKMALNGGRLPPMTPVPESVQHIIEPAFTIGLGALSEHPENGLRCPVRGCGAYFHKLSTHLNSAHRGFGGAMGVQDALSIPRTAKLVSSKHRAALSLKAQTQPGFLSREKGVRARSRRTAKSSKRQGRTLSVTRVTVGAANLRDRCFAQLGHKLIDLQNKIGRSPSEREAVAEWGHALVKAVQTTFGSWNSAKEQCGLSSWRGRRRGDRGRVLESYAAWYEEHGSLPSIKQANRGHKTPYIVSPRVVLREMGCDNWPEAMRRVASLLNIYGGRYGLPPKKESAA